MLSGLSFLNKSSGSVEEKKIETKSIPSSEHWKNVRKRIDQFNELNLQPSHENDELSFQEMNDNLFKILKNGLLAENSNFLMKPYILSTNDSKRFFSATGNKSFAYLQAVYLPYLIDSQYISYSSDYFLGQKFLDFYSYVGGGVSNLDVTQWRETLLEARKIYSEAAKFADKVCEKILPPVFENIFSSTKVSEPERRADFFI